jgi:hypothetical protein
MAMGPGMGGRQHPMTPVAAVAAGFLAGVVGTVGMDTFRWNRNSFLAAGELGSERRQYASACPPAGPPITHPQAHRQRSAQRRTS